MGVILDRRRCPRERATAHIKVLFVAWIPYAANCGTVTPQQREGGGGSFRQLLIVDLRKSPKQTPQATHRSHLMPSNITERERTGGGGGGGDIIKRPQGVLLQAHSAASFL